jgi:hypothetical protein
MQGADGATPESVAHAGQSFRAQFDDGGELVFTIHTTPSGLWIDGATGQAGDGSPMAGRGLEYIEAIARENNRISVAFTTSRPGLVKAAQRRGYRVKGWILEKTL